MPMISYAQNAEDVRLARVFRGKERGFYIDVGAYDPVSCSITKHFYDRGWSGISLEASPVSFARVAPARPRDTTLNVGVAATSGSMSFYDFPPEHAGLSTFSLENARRHVAAGYRYQERRIPVRTLADICREHVRGPIDFMSVDIEGFEREVLEGADLRTYRPQVLLVEATEPLTEIASHQRWEGLVTSAGYRFATFDGLNRYYVPEESPDEIATLLATPPNSLDDYIPYVYWKEIEDLRARVAAFESDPVVNLSARVRDGARAIRERVLGRH